MKIRFPDPSPMAQDDHAPEAAQCGKMGNIIILCGFRDPCGKSYPNEISKRLLSHGARKNEKQSQCEFRQNRRKLFIYKYIREILGVFVLLCGKKQSQFAGLWPEIRNTNSEIRNTRSLKTI